MNKYAQRFKSPEERFWEKVDKSDGCWLWTACCYTDGYGMFWTGEKYDRAHRFSLELEGVDIPSGMWVLHHCDNPKCVNPDHLFIGDASDNAIDAFSKGRRVNPKGTDHHMAKLTEKQVLEIRQLTEPDRVIAEKYGVSRRLVGQIKSRKLWTHI